MLRGFGLKVGPTTPRTFPNRIRELVAGHVTLSTIAEALLAARGTLFEQWQKLEKRLRSLAREDSRVRLLMTAPGVGTIVALTYAAANDDPGRFRSSKAVGAHFGLTPKKYQSGETDVTGRISKIGDGGVRTALYEAANVILTRPVKGSTLRSWAMRVAARAGMRKPKVALARKLAVVLHRMLADGASFHYSIQVLGSGRVKVQYTSGEGHQVQIDGPALAERQEGTLEIELLPAGKAEFHPHLSGASGS